MLELSFFLGHAKTGFHFNTDILETNLVNIILLLILLVYAFTDTIKNTLLTRQTSIRTNIEKAENLLSFAINKLKEIEISLIKNSINSNGIKFLLIELKTNLINFHFKKVENQIQQDISVLKLELKEQKIKLDKKILFLVVPKTSVFIPPYTL